MRLSAVAVAIAATLASVTGSDAQSIMKVGSTPTGIPFTFLDTKTNTIQGVMVDLVTEVGKDVGFQVQVEPMQFSTLIAALTRTRSI
jgi:polar amino acid transport system substrate-binding protein